MESSGFKANRVVRSYRQSIDAAPSEVFPLLCPVREAEWLDGWSFNMIYSESGLAEVGCVFSTSMKGEKDTVWVITKRDVEAHEIEFVRFTPDSRTCVLSISVEEEGDGESSVDITYTYTAVTEGGNAFLDEFTEEKFLHAVKFWENSMNHFLKTGEKLEGA